MYVLRWESFIPTNLDKTTHVDREASITLMATNTKLKSQLIDINLKLFEAFTEDARFKNTSSNQSQTYVSVTINPTGYCWYNG